MSERSYKNPEPSWFKGKRTIIFNVVILIIGALTALYDDGQITKEQTELAALFIAIFNLVLRYITDSPITVHLFRNRNRRK